MQEELLIKTNKTGTTIHFFNTDINENNYPTSTIPAVVKFSSPNSVTLEINPFDGVSLTGNTSTVLWKRNSESNEPISGINTDYVIDTYWPNLNYVSGRTFSQTTTSPMTEVRANALKKRFIDSMNAQFTAGTTSYVFFEETVLDDLYVNIKLERTFDVLDTLNIYNKVSGEYSIRESNVGVVFGKLEAIQKISDANGNRIRIPLRNVPVGVFIPSTEFETPNDLDSDGNRIRLNYKPLQSENYPVQYSSHYFNSESAIFDNEFLKQVPLDGINIHPTFSNVVYTNENGEFVLHNVSVGPQILFFEVDLLKQGLTKDEVALNFFPYPPSYENASIDTIPHYFYRAVPIDVVPSWGNSYQTGYTEVNISANLDLRKWATYIFPPISYSGLSVDSYEYQLISKAPITVQVRDMSKFDRNKLSSGKSTLEVYPSKGIQMVEIQNILDKNENQQWEWANEFSQIKDKVLFYSYGFHGIKLPANIYDDNAYKTNKFGEVQNGKYSQGVWLCGYQLKIFLTKEVELYRTTGLALTSIDGTSKWYDRDHFHCSLYDDIKTLSINEPESGSGLGWGKGLELNKFPYEKAWDKNYPEKYSIPKPPSQERYLNPDGTSAYFSPTRPFIESPRYSDGDIIPGYSWLDGKFNGMGASWASSVEQYTDFATDIIGGAQNADMYKYEVIGAGQFGQNKNFGCYSNGYWNGDGLPVSEVVNGEKFQRIEAGYGYFLYPSSFPKIVPIPSGLVTLSPKQVDIIANPTTAAAGYHSPDAQSSRGPWWYLDAFAGHYNSYSVFNRGKSIAMDLGKKSGTKPLVNDKLNIYRIIDGANRVPYDTRQPVVPTYTCFKIEQLFFTRDLPIDENVKGYEYWTIGSSEMDNYTVYLSIKNTAPEDLTFYISSNGVANQTYVLKPNETKVFYDNVTHSPVDGHPEYVWNSMQNIQIIAKGNKAYDEINNKFSKTSLQFNVYASWKGYGAGQTVDNLFIKDKCNITCEFDATDGQYGNVFYANTLWRGPNLTYYEIDGTNGYAKNTDWKKNNHYMDDMVNIQGIYFNPGPDDIMRTTSDGNSYSSKISSDTGRLSSSGTIEFYWSKDPRYAYPNQNPNGVSTTPAIVISYKGNYANYWENPICGLHATSFGTMAYMTSPGY